MGRMILDSFETEQEAIEYINDNQYKYNSELFCYYEKDIYPDKPYTVNWD